MTFDAIKHCCYRFIARKYDNVKFDIVISRPLLNSCCYRCTAPTVIFINISLESHFYLLSIFLAQLLLYFIGGTRGPFQRQFINQSVYDRHVDTSCSWSPPRLRPPLTANNLLYFFFDQQTPWISSRDWEETSSPDCSTWPEIRLDGTLHLVRQPRPVYRRSNRRIQVIVHLINYR